MDEPNIKDLIWIRERLSRLSENQELISGEELLEISKRLDEMIDSCTREDRKLINTT